MIFPGFYHPQRSCEGYIFTGVCLFTGGMPGPGGLCLVPGRVSAAGGLLWWVSAPEGGVPGLGGVCSGEGRGWYPSMH